MARIGLGLLAFATTAAAADRLPATLVDSFDGWRPTRHADSWSVADGVVTLVNDPAQEGSVLWTTADYGDFVLAFEFRFDGGRVDSGVFLRHLRDQVQLGESGLMKRDMTASPYIEGLGYPVEAQGVRELLRPDDWNRLQIVAVGPRYDVWLNGAHVMHYESTDVPERGPVGLQIHADREMRMRFRDVRLAEL